MTIGSVRSLIGSTLVGSAALFFLSCGGGLPRSVAVPSPPAEQQEDELLEVQLEDHERPSLQLRFTYANRAAMLGFGGVQMWARPERDEIRVTAIVDAPAKEPRWDRCEGAALFADGRRIELDPAYIGRPMLDGVYDAVRLDLGIHQLRRIARASRVGGSVCGDPFELSESQRRSVARFVRWFDQLAEPRQEADAPGFREVGPQLELLPVEDPDPGPYEA